MNTVRFTVRGTTTRDTLVPEFREMVRGVLRTRFRMDAAFETQQDQPIYRLIRVHSDGRLGPAMTARHRSGVNAMALHRSLLSRRRHFPKIAPSGRLSMDGACMQSPG